MKSKSLPINKSTIFDIVRGVLWAAISSLIAVLILALIVKFTGIGDAIVLPIVQVVKILSILLGCVLGIKDKSKGAIKGAIIGLLYTAISVFVFLILKSGLEANSFSLIDFASGLAAGAVSGIIAVNFKKE
ncbi:MAG: TIGR04086 family membrane protein [Clostridia bacterium]